MTMEHIEYYVLNYGYITIFLSLILGLVGLPIPDEILMTIIGYYSKTPAINFCMGFLVAVIGTLCGMTISYFLGKFIGDKALSGVFKWLGINHKKIARVEQWMDKYGFLTIVLGFFIPGFRHMTFYFCGMTHYSLKKYITVGLIAAIIWTLFYLSVGRFVGIMH
ncbi:DedA family protein [Vagococcus coleopterorum]|uniref:DedA family protein n=1 Tax=Vagococcus coleopterorum TaxID=2714946 RepID=A0A6G8AP75_9ENTE|nr:DedA family protein [Vagococcus coleopterorum]QIL46723.1 DedA family protein [Vagococcus coleopterorum]